jgi:hypothetical protein
VKIPDQSSLMVKIVMREQNQQIGQSLAKTALERELCIKAILKSVHPIVFYPSSRKTVLDTKSKPPKLPGSSKKLRSGMADKMWLN